MSLTLVLLILVASINIINFVQMNQKMNGAIRVLYENEGRFPKFEKDKIIPLEDNFGFEMNEETRFETRYFVVKVNEDNSVREIDTSHIAAVTSSDAIEYAEDILQGGKTKGYKGIYKYEVIEESYGKMIIFVNSRAQVQSATVFLLISCAVALMTLLVVFVLVSVLSRKAIKPIINTLEKQKQFITDAGHEIKTPLAIISANVDVLEITSGNNEWVSSIRNQTLRLDKLVKNLLTLSKMEEGNIEMMYYDFDFSEAVYEITKSFEAIATSKNKTLELDIQRGITFHGDLESIHQLISTLVDNALKYSNNGGLIKVSLKGLKKGSKLEIYNTADSVDKQNLNKLFDRFYRTDSSRARETGGYGIGLSIARSIVEAHHGKISVKSEDGVSICFTIVL